MESLGLDLLALLFLAGLLAGCVDAIAGGGGLITVPALLAVGLSPVEALGSNKAQSTMGSGTAMLSYARKGHVRIQDMKLLIFMTFLGAGAGAVLVTVAPHDILAGIIPALLVAAALYFAFGPKAGDTDRAHKLAPLPFALTMGLAIGFYDGFFGPGTGSFWSLAFVALAGFNLLKATAHTKVVNFTSNFAALIFFLLFGAFNWPAAIAMGLGQPIGAWLGANLAIKHGARVIRPLLVIVSLALTVKIVLTDPASPLNGLLG